MMGPKGLIFNILKFQSLNINKLYKGPTYILNICSRVITHK